MAEAAYRNYGCRLIDDLVYKGMRTLVLENELIRVGVLLDKGADIFQFLYKPTDTDFLWRSPRGLFDPRRYRATAPNREAAFLDYYHGGWQEVFPGGGPVNYRGAELGLHGEVTHLGWDYELLEDTPEKVSVSLTVECVRTPFKLTRIMTLLGGKPVLYLEEELCNLAPEAQEFMWGHHPAIGAPFLRKGVKILAPVKELEVHKPAFAGSSVLPPGGQFNWPLFELDGREIDLSTVEGIDGGYSELLYLKGLTEGWYAVMDQQRKLGLGMAWPVDIFPYIWFWLVYGKAPGYPWWDRVYCLALEPWSSIPNNLEEAVRRGKQLRLEGGEGLKAEMTAVVIDGRETVKSVNLDGSLD